MAAVERLLYVRPDAVVASAMSTAVSAPAFRMMSVLIPVPTISWPLAVQGIPSESDQNRLPAPSDVSWVPAAPIKFGQT